MGHLALMAQWT